MQTACIGFKCEDSGTEGPYDLPLWEDARSCPLSGKSQLQLLQKGSTTGQSWVMRNTECASRRADWRKGKPLLQQQLGERNKILWEKQPWNHQGQCRRKAGGAPGAEQKFSAAQERPMMEQAVPMGIFTGTVRSWRMSPVVWTHIGAVVGELQPLWSPCRISLGRTASHGRNLTRSRGRVTMEEWQKHRFTGWLWPLFSSPFTAQGRK